MGNEIPMNPGYPQASARTPHPKAAASGSSDAAAPEGEANHALAAARQALEKLQQRERDVEDALAGELTPTSRQGLEKELKALREAKLPAAQDKVNSLVSAAFQEFQRQPAKPAGDGRQTAEAPPENLEVPAGWETGTDSHAAMRQHLDVAARAAERGDAGGFNDAMDRAIAAQRPGNVEDMDFVRDQIQAIQSRNGILARQRRDVFDGARIRSGDRAGVTGGSNGDPLNLGLHPTPPSVAPPGYATRPQSLEEGRKQFYNQPPGYNSGPIVGQ